MGTGFFLACEQAPSEVGKKFGEQSQWESERRDSAREASGTRTPSSPDRSRLIPLALDHTQLSRPKPNWEPVSRLVPVKIILWVINSLMVYYTIRPWTG